MSDWEVIIAEATTNLWTNPSLEVGTTGWTAAGGSIARSSSDPVFGFYDLTVTPSAGTYDGVYFGTLALTSGTTYTFSAYVKGANGIPYFIAANPSGSGYDGTETFTGDGEWHRIELTFTASASANYYFHVRKYNSADTSAFYVDAVQVEAKSYATTYCDGDVEAPTGFTSSGCSWNGTAHTSTSSRTANTRAGGRIMDLDDNYHFRTMQAIGIGAAPVENYRTAYAMLDGALYEHGRRSEIIFTLSGVMQASAYATFLSYRDALINALQNTADDQPIIVRFTGGSSGREISAYYDGGLEGGNLNANIELAQIRFLACEPSWREVIV